MTLAVRRCMAKPTMPKPAIIKAQVAGSGTPPLNATSPTPHPWKLPGFLLEAQGPLSWWHRPRSRDGRPSGASIQPSLHDFRPGRWDSRPTRGEKRPHEPPAGRLSIVPDRPFPVGEASRPVHFASPFHGQTTDRSRDLEGDAGNAAPLTAPARLGRVRRANSWRFWPQRLFKACSLRLGHIHRPTIGPKPQCLRVGGRKKQARPFREQGSRLVS